MEEKIPKCIGIIMDGNRRWAKEKDLSSFDGHKNGYEKLKEFLNWAKESDISNIIVFAFSKENWSRTEEEVGYLMELFKKAIKNDFKKLAKESRLRFIGDLSRLDKGLQDDIKEIEKNSENQKDMTLTVALSYGGRDELVRAFKKAKKSKEEIREENFSDFLDTKDIPDPDLIIRTGGEIRLSGFLPWQSIYSELFFTKTLWPSFSKKEFLEILSEYVGRKRNFGK